MLASMSERVTKSDDSTASSSSDRHSDSLQASADRAKRLEQLFIKTRPFSVYL
nr:MAG TPA: hypothetical protein [Caudoviricetes sp.]